MPGPDAYALSVSEFTTKPWPFETDVERYAAHGLDAIEVCEVKLGTGDYASQLRSIARNGLTVSSVQSTVHSLYPDSLAPEPLEPAEREGRIKRAIESIAPHVPEGTPFVVVTGAAPRGDCARVCESAVETLRRLAEFASKHRMRVAFEPLNPVLFNSDTALWGLDNALALIDRVGHPTLGVCVDTWNIFETPDVERVIERCGERIFLVQLADWRVPHGNADRVCLGDGSIATASLLRAIRRTGYDGAYVVEIFSSEDLPDSLWRGDLDAAIDRNVVAFERYWKESDPAY